MLYDYKKDCSVKEVIFKMARYVCIFLSVFLVFSLDIYALDLDPTKALEDQEKKLKEKARNKKENSNKYKIEKAKEKRACIKLKNFKLSQSQRIGLSQEWRVPMRSIRFVSPKWTGARCYLLFDSARGVKQINYDEIRFY